MCLRSFQHTLKLAIVSCTVGVELNNIFQVNKLEPKTVFDVLKWLGPGGINVLAGKESCITFNDNLKFLWLCESISLIGKRRVRRL